MRRPTLTQRAHFPVSRVFACHDGARPMNRHAPTRSCGRHHDVKLLPQCLAKPPRKWSRSREFMENARQALLANLDRTR